MALVFVLTLAVGCTRNSFLSMSDLGRSLWPQFCACLAMVSPSGSLAVGVKS